MREIQFRNWLMAQGNAEKTAQSHVSRMKRLENAFRDYGLPYADLDAAFAADGMADVLAALRQSIADLPGKTPPEALVPNSTEYAERLGTALRCADKYREFCMDQDSETNAERIRQHALRSYILPARAKGAATCRIATRQIIDDLDMPGPRNVFQALTGKKFLELAGVSSPRTEGVRDSTTAIFIYDLALLHSENLEALRRKFLAQHADFKSFADCPSFARGEGDYKRALVARTGAIVAECASDDDATLGAAVWDLLVGRGGLESNLIDWRAAAVVDDARKAHQDLIDPAIGRLLRAPDDADAVAEFVAATWNAFAENRPSRPFAESRMTPTMVRALARPDAVLPIRSEPTQRALKLLTGDAGFANAPLSPEEFARVQAMATELRRTMAEEWHWEPRDMWDVQGFLWETCRTADLPVNETLSAAAKEVPMSEPTNLILYGPPGTGKTYTTAYDAVRLCDGDAAYPDDPWARNEWLGDSLKRKALKARYDELVRDKRIAFITFHQSYDYESFVEGLRPAIDGGDKSGADAEALDETAAGSGGLRLTVHDGLFKQIADRARLDTGNAPHGSLAGRLDRTRRVFKIALGRRGNEEESIRSALDGNYIQLGWGGAQDWSDPAFDSFGAILAEWQRNDPTATGKNANVEQLYALRVLMAPGDYVIVSDGRDAVRAFGQVTGEYAFAGTAIPMPHRRAVDWLWRDDAGVPRERLYPNWFRQHSLYELRESLLDWDALDQLVRGIRPEPVGGARPYVLVIDEINRGNVSKIFGELITLIEPDKRLGMDNALPLLLPYSQKLWGVPANLHILGTMNTADRSIALLDTALRRRFVFREIAPDSKVLEKARDRTGIDLPAALTAINDRIEFLIDREHRIGHAFFISCETKTDVDAVMRDKVIPLLQEYFFEDWGRLAAVLGETADSARGEKGAFLSCREIKDPFGQGESRFSWSVRETFALDCYSRLLGKAAAPAPTPSEVASDEPQA